MVRRSPWQAALVLAISGWVYDGIAAADISAPKANAPRISSRRVTERQIAVRRPSQGRVSQADVRRGSRAEPISVDEVQRFARRAMVGASCAIVVSLLLLVFLKKSRPGLTGTNASEGLKLLSTISIAPRCCVSLIQARDHTIVVARDASGLKEMIVLPETFDAFLDTSKLTSATAMDRQQPEGAC